MTVIGLDTSEASFDMKPADSILPTTNREATLAEHKQAFRFVKNPKPDGGEQTEIDSLHSVAISEGWIEADPPSSDSILVSLPTKLYD